MKTFMEVATQLQEHQNSTVFTTSTDKVPTITICKCPDDTIFMSDCHCQTITFDELMSAVSCVGHQAPALTLHWLKEISFELEP
jgi:hypothetical protein